MLLSHADRSRFVAPEERGRLGGLAGRVQGSVLHDGFGWGLWRLERDRDSGAATLVVGHLHRATARATDAVAAEGRRLLRFLAPEAEPHDVRFVAPAGS